MQFTVCHRSIATGQLHLKVSRDVPVIGRPAAQTARIEMNIAFAQPRPGRSAASRGKIIQWNRVAQSGFGIFIEQMQQAVKLFVSKLVQLRGNAT